MSQCETCPRCFLRKILQADPAGHRRLPGRRVLEPYFGRYLADTASAKSLSSEAAASIWAIVERNRVVGFWENLDAQRRTMNYMDDYLYDEIWGGRGIPLSTEEMDEIIERSMRLAKHRIPA